MGPLLRTCVLACLLLPGCKKKDDGDTPAAEDSVVFGVPQTATMSLPGLSDGVEVLYDAHGVPTIFGRTDADVARVNARRLSIVSSQSALDATTAGYEVGTRNVVDVLNAQNTLFQAIRDYANARYDYVNNLLRLKQQAGLLSPEDVYRLDAELVPPPAPTASSRTGRSPYPTR